MTGLPNLGEPIAPVIGRRHWLPSIPPIGLNMIANGIGRVWMMLMSLVFVPFYIRLLGVEAYGVIGFFATLMVLFSFLDLGLPTTLNRELARRAASEDERSTMRTVVRTLEIIYVGIGLPIGAAIFLLAGPIARHWLNSEDLPVTEVETAIRLMGVVIACQWPSGLYAGGLLGLQRQITANILMGAVMTIRGVGAIAVLAFIDASVPAFFAFQAILSLAAVIVWRAILLRSLPPGSSRFDIAVLKSIWKFAAGMMGVALVSIVLMQADKTVLSAIVPLEEYAHYVLASALAAAAAFAGSPIYNAAFPRFTELVAAGDKRSLRTTFHAQAQLVGAIVSAMGIVVMMFSQELAYFWTHDAALAANISPMARMLALGSMLNAMMLIPHALSLAYGKAHYALITNSIAAVAIVPLVYWLARNHGGIGASFAWPLLNLGYILIQAPIVLGLLLPGERGRWIALDVAAPFAAAAVAIAPFRLLTPEALAPISGLVLAGFAGLAGLIAAALATSQGRSILRSSLRAYRLGALTSGPNR